MGQVSTGVLSGRSPYLAVGGGPPLVSVQVLTSGMERRVALSRASKLGCDFRVTG